jgi:hypothetical protein
VTEIPFIRVRAMGFLCAFIGPLMENLTLTRSAVGWQAQRETN